MIISSTKERGKISCDQYLYEVVVDGFKYSYTGFFQSYDGSSEGACQVILNKTVILRYFEREESEASKNSPALYIRKSEAGGFQNSKIRIEIKEMKTTESIQI
jgi:hypothetical protein